MSRHPSITEKIGREVTGLNGSIFVHIDFKLDGRVEEISYSEKGKDQSTLDKILTAFIVAFEVGRGIYGLGTPRKEHEIAQGVRVKHIREFIAHHYGIEMREFVGAKRNRKIARPRQIAMYLSRVMTDSSLPEIGKYFGGRDHTTALHAVRTIHRMQIDSPQFAQQLSEFKARIREQQP